MTHNLIDPFNVSLPINQVFYSNIICYCQPDFYGKFCENQYNECQPNPCQHNGICIDGIDNYTCSCKSGFMGHSCEIDCSQPNNKYICIEPTTTQIPDQSSTSLSLQIYLSSQSHFSTQSYPIETSLIETISWSQFLSTPLITLNMTIHSSEVTSPTSLLTSSLILLTSSLILPTSSLILPSSSISVLPTSSISVLPSVINITDIPVIKKPIFVSRFNGINSSLIYQISRHKKNHLSLTMKFKAEINNGILLYTKGLNDIEIIIYLENDIVKSNISLSNKTNEFMIFNSSGIQIDNNKNLFNSIYFDIWVDQTIEKSIIKAILKLNFNNSIEGSMILQPNKSYVCFNLFYFGHLPSILISSISVPFKGCIANIIIDDKEQFFENSLSAIQIDECNLINICDKRPCRNYGVCQQDFMNNWNCQCKPGFKGAFCQEASCENSPCQNDGICILTHFDQFLCLCTSDWKGKTCEKSNRIVNLMSDLIC